MPATSDLENGNSVNVANLLCQEPDKHTLIITLEREMKILKQSNAQEMDKLKKENTTLWEQYLKLQEDQSANSVSTIVTHQTHPTKIDEANMTWQEGKPSITQFRELQMLTLGYIPLLMGLWRHSSCLDRRHWPSIVRMGSQARTSMWTHSSCR